MGFGSLYPRKESDLLIKNNEFASGKINHGAPATIPINAAIR
jgi:hypothetical protein